MEGAGHRVEVTVAAFQTLVDVEVGRRSGLPLAISRHCSPGNTALTFSEARGNGPPFSCHRGRKGAFLIAECVFIYRLSTILCLSESDDFKERGPMFFCQFCVCDFMTGR